MLQMMGKYKLIDMSKVCLSEIVWISPQGAFFFLTFNRGITITEKNALIMNLWVSDLSQSEHTFVTTIHVPLPLCLSSKGSYSTDL